MVAHPECEERVLTLADYIGSTTALLNYTKASPARSFIVATEAGILHQMKKASPGKTFIPAPPDNGCACNECPYMRLNTLEKVYLLHAGPGAGGDAPRAACACGRRCRSIACSS